MDCLTRPYQGLSKALIRVTPSGMGSFDMYMCIDLPIPPIGLCIQASARSGFPDERVPRQSIAV